MLSSGLCGSGCKMMATGQNAQGKRLFEQGQYNAAIEAFNQALRNDPRNADALYNLGATWMQLGRTQKNPAWLQAADQYFRSALSVDPTHTDSYRSLVAIMVESNRVADAWQMLQSWRASAPMMAEPVIEMARMQTETGNLATAKQLLVDALNIEPNNARALASLGRLREQSGELQLALENYIRSYQANNLQPEVAQRIAALQGTLRTAAQNVPFQPGQIQLGNAQQYIPR
jgi:tetratricopeptide (TPR) repeat protein